jgi:ABC-type glutathione transport system ATPase component
MQEIQRETGTTFLLSTHDRELAERCERRIYIRNGVVVEGESTPIAAPKPAPVQTASPWRVIEGASAVVDRTGSAESNEDRRRA